MIEHFGEEIPTQAEIGHQIRHSQRKQISALNESCVHVLHEQIQTEHARHHRRKQSQIAAHKPSQLFSRAMLASRFAFGLNEASVLIKKANCGHEQSQRINSNVGMNG